MIDEKDKTIQFYVSDSEKALFKATCARRRSTMSREIRKFMFAYINTPDVDERIKYYAVDVKKGR